MLQVARTFGLLKKGEHACAEVMDSGKELLNRVTGKEDVSDEDSASMDDSIARGRCLANLKQIGLGMMMYADDYSDFFPNENGVDGLRQILTYGYVVDNKLFACPGDKEVIASSGTLTPKNCSYVYVYVRGLRREGVSRPSKHPLVLDRSGNHRDCINVLFVDGHVETVASAEFESKVIKPIRDQFRYDRRRLDEVLGGLQRQFFHLEDCREAVYKARWATNKEERVGNRYHAQRCQNNLKQIGLGMSMYADDHDGAFPAGNGVDGLRQISTYGVDNKLFACPGDERVVASTCAPNWCTCSYVYVGGLNLDKMSHASYRMPLVFERPGNHCDYIMVLFADGHVSAVSLDEIEHEVIEPIRDQFRYERRRLHQVMQELENQGFPTTVFKTTKVGTRAIEKK